MKIKNLLTLTLILISSPAYCALTYLYDSNDANGYTKTYYETNTYKKTADGRFVEVVFLTNYDRAWKSEGKTVKSSMSLSTWDCKNGMFKPGSSYYYSELNGEGNLSSQTIIERNAMQFIKWPSPSASPLTVDLVCNLKK